MIGIIDYGSGNVFAIINILKQHKIPFLISDDPVILEQADRFILPGVGAFDPTMRNLLNSGIVEFLNDQVLIKKKKILGICVGMHLLANDSEEGKLSGLGYISGRVRRISNDYFTSAPHLPHMGWNSINLKSESLLFDGIDSKMGFYFLHSYQFVCEEPKNASAEVLYGKSLSCAVENENIFGVQFHPEKSHSNGVKLLKNFAKLI